MSTKIKRALFLLLAFAVLYAGCSRKEETAKEENPKIREQMALAEKYLGEQKFDEAIEALLEAVELDPEDVDVYLKLSEIYADQEMDMEAMDILEQGWEASQDEALRDRYVEVCTEYAEKYFNDEEFDSAIEAYDRAIAADETCKKAYLGLHQVYLYLEEYDSADVVLEEGCLVTGDKELEEIRFKSLTELGQKFVEEENYEYAIPCLENLLEAGRGDDNTRLALSNAYAMMEEYKKSIEILENLENKEDPSIQSSLATAYARYGEQCFNEGNTEEAVTYLTKARELSPDTMDIYVTMIALHMDSGDLAAAKTVVDEAVAKFMNADAAANERFDDLLYEISGYYSETEDMAAGLSFWEKAVALKPDDESYKGELENYRATAADEAAMKAGELLENGDGPGAMSYFKRAYVLSPASIVPGFLSNENGTYYLNEDGTFRTGWYDAGDGDIYYFNPAQGAAYGCSVMGWQNLDGSEYYFMDDGRLLTNEETPDGFMVGPDGKKIGTVPTEEETEEETEPEAEEETESGQESEGQEETSQETKPSGSGSGTHSGSLKLNPELLNKAREGSGAYAVKKEELFSGAEGVSLTLNDVYKCMSQYGMQVQWILEESTYELGMGDMVIWVFPGQSLAGDGVVVKDAEEYRESLRNKTLPEGTTFAVQFDARATGTNETVDIEKIREINGQ